MFARLNREQPASIPADEARTNSSGPKANRRKSKLTTAAEVAGIVGVLIVGVPVVIGLAKDSDHNSSGASIPEPAFTATPSSPGKPAGEPFDFELFDDFSGSTINLEKWILGRGFDSAPPLIYAQDGALHMQVTKENAAGEDSAALQVDLARPARAISFEMALLSSDGANDGGGYAVVSSRDSRKHKLVMGPDGDGFPAAGYYICDKASGCDDGVYEDFAHPGGNRLQLKKVYKVLIHQSDTGWSLQIDGFPEVKAGLEDGPIRSLGFSLYSFGTGVFHVTVDNVKIDYAI